MEERANKKHPVDSPTRTSRTETFEKVFRIKWILFRNARTLRDKGSNRLPCTIKRLELFSQPHCDPVSRWDHSSGPLSCSCQDDLRVRALVRLDRSWVGLSKYVRSNIPSRSPFLTKCIQLQSTIYESWVAVRLRKISFRIKSHCGPPRTVTFAGDPS